jgi:hypothetical protein
MGGGGIPIISPIINAVTGIVDVVTSAVGIGPIFNKAPEMPTISYASSYEASSIISQPVYVPPPPSAAFNYQAEYQQAPNQGVRQQLSPQTDNKIPVVYGTSYLGGAVIDLSISENNQDIFYVFALCEVTNSEFGNTPDVFSFGNIYWGGKLVNFQANGYTVASLTDESTGVVDTTVEGKMDFYLYRNGSNLPTNTDQTAIEIMSNPSLVYQWDETKLMTNCVFAIVHLQYSQSANITSLQQTRFQVINPRQSPGDCFLDYFRSERYGAAIALNQIDTASLTALSAYSNERFTFINFAGTSSTQARFAFNGYLPTSNTVMSNLQNMASCCDCLIKYNEITAKWGVIVQTPVYDVSMAINDSNMVTAINISPLDSSSTFNITECKFSDGSAKDVFDSAIFDLSEIDPALLYPNEPVNKQTVDIPLVNNSVQAQYICNRLLKGAREDLSVRCGINFTGMQLEAGDIITLTSANYGWDEKLFRISKVTETFADDGGIICELTLLEFNPTVYDDVNITQFQPSPNTGIGDPNVFGTIPAPVVTNIVTSGFQPSFDVIITTSAAGVVQYAELWYSVVPNPTEAQLFYFGTTQINPNGNPYDINTAMPAINITTLEHNTYYFFSVMRNVLVSSNFSPSSAPLVWDPTWIDDVTGFYNANQVLDWQNVYSARLAGYTIRYHYGNNTDWGSGILLFNGFLTQSNYSAVGLPNTLTTVMIKAVDTLGHESVNAASLLYTGTTGLNSNVVFEYDFKAMGWAGTIVGGSVVGGNIVANDTGSFYGLDDQSLYEADDIPFYAEYATAELIYTSLPIYINTALTGSLGEMFSVIFGRNITIQYRLVNSASFYGPDAESKYGIDDNASFYGTDTGDADFVTLPGLLPIKKDIYQFRVYVGSGVEAEIDELVFVVDAPSIVENLANVTIDGSVVPYIKTYTYINTVLVTLQDNALGVVTVETDKTIPLQPTVTGYNSSHVAISGAKADITVQGY